MRVGYDATPAAVQRAGVGRYARELLRALVQEAVDDQFILSCAAPSHAVRSLLDQLPPGAWRDVRCLPVPERYLTATWQRAQLPLTIERLIGRFDIFHATDFVAPPSRRPIVVTIHDLSFLRFPELGEPRLVAYLREAAPRTLKRAAVVICVSSTVAAEVADAYPWVRHRIVAIPNGVEVAAPSGVREPPAVPTVLIVGTIEPRKNHLTLFSAMDEVRRSIPEVRLVVAGRVGWQADSIVERLRVLVAQGQTTFVDSPGDDQLEELFASASAFVYPSRYEGFGLPVLEAMAWGMPVVAGDIPALRETGGDAARYAAPDDPVALAAAIIGMLEDTAENRRMTELGVQRSRCFTWEKTARRTRRAYGLALGEVAP